MVFRRHRELRAIECPCPTEEWMGKTPTHLKTRLEQEREIVFSYFVPNIGRFRTNVRSSPTRCMAAFASAW